MAAAKKQTKKDLENRIALAQRGYGSRIQVVIYDDPAVAVDRCDDAVKIH